MRAAFDIFIPVIPGTPAALTPIHISTVEPRTRTPSLSTVEPPPSTVEPHTRTPSLSTVEPLPSTVEPRTRTPSLSTMEPPPPMVELPTPTQPPLEIIQGTVTPSPDRLGKLTVDYPFRMSPGSSSTVFVQISVVDMLFGQVILKDYDRVETPPDAPLNLHHPTFHEAFISGVEEFLIVQLTSPTFLVQSLYLARQRIDLSGDENTWGWNIVAPDTLGRHILTVIVSNENDTPIWTGSLDIEVVAFTPTPIPTDTPTSIPTRTPTLIPTPTPSYTPSPTLTYTPTAEPPTPTPTVISLPTPTALIRVRDQLIDNSATLLIATMTLIGILFPTYLAFQNNRRKEEIKSLEMQITHSTQERQKLNSKIEHLSSIRWWQFWRR